MSLLSISQAQPSTVATIASIIDSYITPIGVQDPALQMVVQQQLDNIKFDRIILNYDNLDSNKFLSRLFRQFQTDLAEIDPIIIRANEDKVVRILKKFAETIGGRMALMERFHTFGISEEKIRVEIALLCASKSSAIFDNLKNFAISDQTAIAEIAKTSLEYNLNYTAERFGLFNLPKTHPLSEFVAWYKAEGISEMLGTIHDDDFSEEIQEDFLSLIDPATRKCYGEIPPVKVEQKYLWGKVVRLQLAKLKNEGVSVDKAVAWLASDKTFYEFGKFKRLHEALFRLSRDGVLSAAEKGKILDAIATSSLPLRDIDHYLIILNHKKAGLLRKAFTGASFSFPGISWHIFYKEFGGSSSEADFTEKFRTSFGSSRNPDAIRVFAAKMKRYIANTLNTTTKEKIDTSLKLIINSVLDGSLEKIRSINPQWQMLEKTTPGLLKEWEKPLEMKVLSGDEVVRDSSDPTDLLLMGSEGAHSCLDIHGNYLFNANVLGAMLHGWNRVVVVKNSKGTTLSRAVLRVLLVENKPILFLDQIYPSKVSDAHLKAILYLAQSKAKAMGLKLASVRGDGAKLAPLTSLGGPAPTEYVDACGGSQQDGIYTINKASLLTGVTLSAPHFSDVEGDDDF